MPGPSKYYRMSEAGAYLRVSYRTIRSYVKNGKIQHDTTPGGQAVFTKEQLDAFKGIKTDVSAQPQTGRIAFYIRESDGNKTAMKTQEEQLTTAYGTPDKVYKDAASGLNENRRAYNRMLDDAQLGKFDALAITTRDRLTRFGYKTTERLLKAYGVRTIILDTDDHTPPAAHEELVRDLMSIIASFSGKYYKLRSP